MTMTTYTMRHLSGDPKANLVILGDFNEGQPVGSDYQALAPRQLRSPCPRSRSSVTPIAASNAQATSLASVLKHHESRELAVHWHLD